MPYELQKDDECLVSGDYKVEGAQAFNRGNVVKIIEISPDRLQPGNKYLVHSDLLGQDVRLPGLLLKRISCPWCHQRLAPGQDGGFSDTCPCGWGDPEAKHSKQVAADADASIERMETVHMTGYYDEWTANGVVRRPDSHLPHSELIDKGAIMDKAVEWRNKAMGLPDRDVEDACPLCNTAALTGKHRCPSCGRNLAGVQFEDGKQVDAGKPFCPMCHVELEAGVLSCAACGWKYETQDDAPAGKLGYIMRDIVIGGVIAFKEGDYVKLEAESPDPQRPQYKYVVESKSLARKFRLSDDDISF